MPEKFKIFGREPALILGFISAALGLGTALGVPGLSGEQAALVVAAITAVFGVATAVQTRPIGPAAFTTLVTAVAALAAGYGFDVGPGVVGAVDAMVLTGLSLLMRGQVKPKPSLVVAA
ncbi:hypothetical protein GCM10023224_04920 [Streptomonospora halophila]|uniref:Holin n=1 Tax=Streptomonospora halophila TaxID=427369 RepID=A0ABP9G526_9ACTN